jgi:hypothetical protein
MDGTKKIHKVKKGCATAYIFRHSGVSVSCELASTNNHINTDE